MADKVKEQLNNIVSGLQEAHATHGQDPADKKGADNFRTAARRAIKEAYDLGVRNNAPESTQDFVEPKPAKGKK